MNTSPLIVGLGELLWDIYPEGRHLGGAPSNVVWNAVCLEHRAVLVSRVGRDELGDDAVHRLSSRGIPTDYIQRDPSAPTGYVSVSLSEDRIPSFQCSGFSAYDVLCRVGTWETLIPETGAVVYGTTGQRNIVARDATRSFLRRVLTGLKVYDVNVRKFTAHTRQIVRDGLAAADVVKVNAEELRMLGDVFAHGVVDPPDCAQALVRRYNLAALLVTLGADGAVAVTHDELVYVPGHQVDPVDTTGAGDAFTAGFVARTLDNRPLGECLRFANLLAAFNTTQYSGTPDFSVDDVQQFAAQSRERSVAATWRSWQIADD